MCVRPVTSVVPHIVRRRSVRYCPRDCVCCRQFLVLSVTDVPVHRVGEVLCHCCTCVLVTDTLLLLFSHVQQTHLRETSAMPQRCMSGAMLSSQEPSRWETPLKQQDSLVLRATASRSMLLTVAHVRVELPHTVVDVMIRPDFVCSDYVINAYSQFPAATCSAPCTRMS